MPGESRVEHVRANYLQLYQTYALSEHVRISTVGSLRAHPLLRMLLLRSTPCQRLEGLFLHALQYHMPINLSTSMLHLLVYRALPATPELPKTLEERTCPKHAAGTDVACSAPLP